MNKRVVLSWSGGKDSCMALSKLTHAGYEVASLLTTVPKEMDRTFAHGEKIEMIEKQSQALSIPVHFVRCPFERYTETFIEDLIQLKNKYGIDQVVFGDIYLDGHREWGEKVAAEAGLKASFPLWCRQEDSLRLLAEFIQSGYKAITIRVREGTLDESWLGKELNEEFLEKIQTQDVCPLGENGEYHTFVYGGPLFNEPVLFTYGKILAQKESKRLEIQPLSR